MDRWTHSFGLLALVITPELGRRPPVVSSSGTSVRRAPNGFVAMPAPAMPGGIAGGTATRDLQERCPRDRWAGGTFRDRGREWPEKISGFEGESGRENRASRRRAGRGRTANLHDFSRLAPRIETTGPLAPGLLCRRMTGLEQHSVRRQRFVETDARKTDEASGLAMEMSQNLPSIVVCRQSECCNNAVHCQRQIEGMWRNWQTR